jgi:hypothetical protein
LPWCPESFLGGASDVTTLEGSVAEAVFPARLPRNSSALTCTSTLHGGASNDASNDDEDVALGLVFMVRTVLQHACSVRCCIHDRDNASLAFERRLSEMIKRRGRHFEPVQNLRILTRRLDILRIHIENASLAFA